MESSQTQPSPSIFLGIYLLFSIQSHPFPSLVAQSMFFSTKWACICFLENTQNIISLNSSIRLWVKSRFENGSRSSIWIQIKKTKLCDLGHVQASTFLINANKNIIFFVCDFFFRYQKFPEQQLLRSLIPVQCTHLNCKTKSRRCIPSSLWISRYVYINWVFLNSTIEYLFLGEGKKRCSFHIFPLISVFYIVHLSNAFCLLQNLLVFVVTLGPQE